MGCGGEGGASVFQCRGEIGERGNLWKDHFRGSV